MWAKKNEYLAILQWARAHECPCDDNDKNDSYFSTKAADIGYSNDFLF